jgi:NADH-quinone oxidoreductase subunit G
MERLDVRAGHAHKRPAPPRVLASPTPQVPAVGSGKALLATWRQLLDNGSLQDGEPHLAGTARPAVARLSAAQARRLGVSQGQPVTVSSGRGSVTLPVELTDVPDGVVWLPGNSGSTPVHRSLAVGHGAVVGIVAGHPWRDTARAGDEA